MVGTNPELMLASQSRTERLECLSEEDRRAYRAITGKMRYVPNLAFSSSNADEVFFGDGSEVADIPAWRCLSYEAGDLQPCPDTARLTAEQEAGLFLQFNYARYRLSRLLEAQHRNWSGVRARLMTMWYRRVLRAENALTEANMGLVLAMAKRTRMRKVEFDELVSEGNMALLRSIERFDVSRGLRFSTYACRAILQSFIGLARKTSRYRNRFSTDFDPKLGGTEPSPNKHECQVQDSVETVRDILSRNRARLTPVERTVVRERFAIGGQGKGRSLSMIATMVGLTRERVRQILNQALGRIQAVLEEDCP